MHCIMKNAAWVIEVHAKAHACVHAPSQRCLSTESHGCSFTNKNKSFKEKNEILNNVEEYNSKRESM